MRKFAFAIAALLALLLLVQQASAEEGTVCAYFFYSNGCPYSAAVNKYMSGEIEPRYPNLDFRRIEVGGNGIMEMGENGKLQLKFNDEYGFPRGARDSVPLVFIGGKYLIWKHGVMENIEAEIKACSARGGCDCPSAGDGIPQEFSAGGLVSLAAADALNLCAIALIALFIAAILLRAGKGRKNALHSGLAFSAAVFMMYFAFGLLLMSGFRAGLGFMRLGSTWLHAALGAVLVLFGLLGATSTWRGWGRIASNLSKDIGAFGGRITKDTTATWGAFVAGIAASFFLTPCTAGRYVFAAEMLSHLRLSQALPYLFIYVCIFMIPMLAATLIAHVLIGQKKRAEGEMLRRMKVLRIAIGVLLIAIGAAMVLGLV
ncbi:MAG: hypothetical protein V1676_04070 [Candidatus Diapherotrites archaeon]